MTKQVDLARKTIAHFRKLYRQKHNEDYLVNWPQIKVMEKVCRYYSEEQLLSALEYYFEYYMKQSLWEFVDDIDSFLRKIHTSELADEHVNDLLDKTKRRLKEIEES